MDNQRIGLANLQAVKGLNQKVNLSGVATLVDIVMVIDGTGSMQNLLDAVKERALNLYQDIINGLKGKNRKVEKMRIKVLVYRDIYVDANAFEESDFFTIPDEASEFKSFVSQIKASGGGDEPESGLEALYRAMCVRFQENNSNKKARQIIIVMTDASAHRLDDPQRFVDPEHIYPEGVPSDLRGIEDVWAGLNHNAKRLLIFAPNALPWTDMQSWSNAQYVPSRAGEGIGADIFDTVIETISGSIG